MRSIGLIVFVVFGLQARRFAFASEWVKLNPIQPIGDSLKMHSDGLLDSTFPIRTTTSLPDLNRIGLAAQDASHQVNPIKYEDLEHIVGPGFEEELERYYDQHKHDLEESTRRTLKPTTKPFKVYDPIDDPWSIYDKPIGLQTTSHPNITAQPEFSDRFSMFDDIAIGKPTTVTFVTKAHSQQPSKVVSNTMKVNSQFDDPIQVHTNSSDKKRVKPKLYKLVQLPIVQQTSAPSSLFGFSSIMQFFRKIQNSFVTNSSRSIQDKIKMLESFRDDLMGNISKWYFP